MKPQVLSSRRIQNGDIIWFVETDQTVATQHRPSCRIAMQIDDLFVPLELRLGEETWSAAAIAVVSSEDFTALFNTPTPLNEAIRFQN